MTHQLRSRRPLSTLLIILALASALSSALAAAERVERSVGDLPRSERGWLAFGYHLNSTSDGEQILIVHRLFPEGPAETAGLKPGDVITHLGDDQIDFSTSLEAIEYFARIRPGEELTVRIARPEGSTQLKMVAIEMPRDIYSSWQEIYHKLRRDGELRKP